MRTPALVLYAAATVAVAFLVSLCGCQSKRDVGNPPQASPSCGSHDVPTRTFDRADRREPAVTIPIPYGWRYVQGSGQSFVRGILDNPGLAVGSKVPNVLVAVDHSDLPRGRRYPVVPGWQALSEEFSDVARSASVTSVRMVGKCGHPGMEVEYVIDGQKSSAFIVAVEDTDRTWRARVNFLSPAPANPTWLADTKAMVDGLSVSGPGR